MIACVSWEAFALSWKSQTRPRFVNPFACHCEPCVYGRAWGLATQFRHTQSPKLLKRFKLDAARELRKEKFPINSLIRTMAPRENWPFCFATYCWEQHKTGSKNNSKFRTHPFALPFLWVSLAELIGVISGCPRFGSTIKYPLHT